MPEPLIIAQSVTKLFGLRPALRDVSFAIAPGSAVALLGLNGSGKTTLLRILAGLSKPSAGTVTLGGWTIPQEVAAVRAQIGVVAHQPILYGELTAAENLDFYGRLYGLSDRTERLRAALARVGMDKHRDSLVRTFSRGMQQRVALARAMLHDPAVMLLDEPYTGLDVSGEALLDELIGQWQAAGRTLILALHDLERAAIVCDHALILRQGRVAHFGAISAVATMADGGDLSSLFAQVTAPSL